MHDREHVTVSHRLGSQWKRANLSLSCVAFGSCSKHEAGDPGPPPCAPCAGCGRRIAERFYLLALGRQWHLRCLKCCECELALDTELSCYARDGSIYCRDDYYRRFSAQRCAGCQLGISASELVMRARDLVFHLRCFSCAACRRPLTPGEHFGMRGALVYCRPHFEGLLQAEEASARDENPTATTLGPPEGLRGAWVEAGEEVLRSAQAAGRGRSGPQKPRPRKRKSVGPHAGDMLDYSSIGCADAVGLDAAHAFSTPQKSKRMRTSFKHHQLRTMKSFFALNHNPDAKDLKQLSQKTGLTKRVLQVWFQNARAKFRRNLLRPEESTLDKATDGHSLAPQPAAGELSSPPLSPALSVTTLTDLTNPMRPTVTSVPCMESAGSPSRQMQQHAQLF
uniref:LIM homeobox 2 n=1 Tax=Eptatretus burgeri TaxID=7764 RepID=A0A8C4NK83_EPTBU